MIQGQGMRENRRFARLKEVKMQPEWPRTDAAEQQQVRLPRPTGLHSLTPLGLVPCP